MTRTFDGGRVRPLVGVDLDVYPDQILAVVGASGSGKTTLLNVAGLLDVPDTGEVLVGGRRVSGGSERRRSSTRARALGFVFQDSLVDPRRTALENVSLTLLFAGVPREDRRSAALSALRAAGIAHRAQTHAGDLSGGERQRVAVARAVAHQPRALLCDEPTGNLDDDATCRVFALLRSYATAGRAVVMVTHDLELAGRCDRVVRVRHGEVVEG